MIFADEKKCDMTGSTAEILTEYFALGECIFEELDGTEELVFMLTLGKFMNSIRTIMERKNNETS